VFFCSTAFLAWSHFRGLVELRKLNSDEQEAKEVVIKRIRREQRHFPFTDKGIQDVDEVDIVFQTVDARKDGSIVLIGWARLRNKNESKAGLYQFWSL
jgi:hypothetical protein